MADSPSDLAKLRSKPRVHFGSLEEQEAKRVKLDDGSPAPAPSSGGIDLEALGTHSYC